MRQLGYVEGHDIRFEYRGAGGQLDQQPRLAHELVALNVDAIVVGNASTARAARQATSSIPIIMALYNYDPVAGGLIDSFSQPGGNITGIFTRTSELAGKQLELLKEAIAHLTRLAVFWDALSRSEFEELEPAARSMGIHLQPTEFRAPYDFDAAFRAAKRQKVDAVMILTAPAFYVERVRLGVIGLKNGLAVSSSFKDLTEAGGLMTYSTDFLETYDRVAYFLDRVLRGAKPADLPVEQATQFRLVVNLKTFKTLGINIPESILSRADEVIR
jgi:putative ABC transport system substrate-binding protein